MKTASINAFDHNAEKAMKYVYVRQHGYAKELKSFGEDVINSMKTAGFLKTGWTEEAETFGTTKMLQQYVEIVFGKISLSEKFQIFISWVLGKFT